MFYDSIMKNKKRNNVIALFLQGSIFLFALTILCSFLVTLFNAVTPQIISLTIDCVLGNEQPTSMQAFLLSVLGGRDLLQQNIWILAVAVAVIALLSAVFLYLRNYINARANQKMMCRMRRKLFSHLQRLPLSWHVNHNTGDIIQRCTTDADVISNFISHQMITLFRIIILTVLSLTFMFMMNAALAAIAAAFIPLMLGYSVYFHKKASKSFRKCDENEGILSTIAQENFTGVRVVRAFGREQYEREKFEKQNVYYTGLWVGVEKYLALFWSSNDMLSAVQLMFIIVIGCVFCVNGQLSAGDFVAFISYNTMLMGPIRQLGRIISNMSRASVSVERIAEILSAEEERYGEALPLSGDIEFKNVTFGYDANKPVLQNVSFTLKQGQTLGIIGSTGSGKSTVAYLLDGLYHLTNGDITIGGQSIRNLSPATLRANVGFVLQEGYLFSGTIERNLSIASQADETAVQAAAKTACVHDNVTAFANGYQTMVGERGVTLSGGQKQRVSIARTLLRNTPYLIFDDSLSAVDSQTDAQIRANLAQRKNATTIIIAHRITTVLHADQIIVLENGKIVERGAPNELYQKQGVYRRIYDVQMSLPDELKEENA